ncbi:MAG: glucose-6-phosphate isomerase [Patescibacteria group bacterium]
MATHTDEHLPAYDTTLMFSDKIGTNGMPAEDMPRLTKELEGVHKTLIDDWRTGKASFFELPDAADDVRASLRAAKTIAQKAKTLIVAGIGGSDLGSRALIDALGTKGKGMEVRFIGANTDPEEIATLIASVDLKKCALNVISKSGDTIEPMSAFLILRKEMLHVMSPEKFRERVVITTGTKGALHDIAQKEGYLELTVPESVGGRFSALTPVGLFPAVCRGIPIQRLLNGSKEMRDAFVDSSNNALATPLLFAGLHVEAALRRNQSIDVLMPYSEALRSFAFWYRQLWAESLGKAQSRKGEKVYRGLTPIAALGATDQHSQLQLYNEGPVDKIVTFIEIETFRKDFRIPSAFKGTHAAERLGGVRMSDIIHTEREATARTLASHGRPSGTLTIKKITPESVGALMMFFMIATAAAAELLDVNAYDQPGVEEGKQFIGKSLDSKKLQK